MTTYRYIYGKLELISSKCGKIQVTLYKGDYGEKSERKQETQLNTNLLAHFVVVFWEPGEPRANSFDGNEMVLFTYNLLILPLRGKKAITIERFSFFPHN